MKCEVTECETQAADEGNLQPCSACNKKFCSLHLRRVSGDLLCEDCAHCSQEGCTNPARAACARCGGLLCEEHAWESRDQVVCYPCDLALSAQRAREYTRGFGQVERKAA